MIDPVNSGKKLLREIEVTEARTPVLWWLGQSGFALKCRSMIFYIDPYLSEYIAEHHDDPNGPLIRMTSAPFSGAEVRHADLVLCTHKHADHLDPGTVRAMLTASPGAKLVVPRSAAEQANRLGVGDARMLTTDAGFEINFSKDGSYSKIHAVPSAHEKLDWTPLAGYPYLGYLIRFDEYTIYHAGDCVPYEDLAEKLKPYNVTVALLPINGRDPRRGVDGNFEIAEAAQLAEDIGARWLVPMHYDMFPFDTVDINQFIAHMLGHRPAQRFKVFQCGEKWAVPDD